MSKKAKKLILRVLVWLFLIVLVGSFIVGTLAGAGLIG